MELTVNNIKNLEEKIFPDVSFTGDDIQNIKHSHGNNPWVIFAPHFYAKHPAILTEKFVEELKEGGTLLSVGSGPAYLEQFLVKAYNVPIKNITLSDLSSMNVPCEFDFFKFDMHNKWPEFGKKFDYIIFPESVFFSIGAISDKVKKYDPKVKIPMLKHLIEESLIRLKSYGEIRIKSILPKPEHMTTLVEEITKHYSMSMYQCRADFLFIKKSF